jgi:hypothetical protein
MGPHGPRNDDVQMDNYKLNICIFCYLLVYLLFNYFFLCGAHTFAGHKHLYYVHYRIV